MINIIIGLVILGSFSAKAAEVDCYENNWSFTIEKNESYKVGSLIFKGNILERVEMVKKSVQAQEFSKLKALYEGKTSLDSYKLFVFKEKEKKSYISFLESESILGHKKVLELRCSLSP